MVKDVDLEAFVDPPMSSDAEIDSFDLQAKKVNFSEAPAKLNEALAFMEKAYAPVKWKIREDFCSREHIRDVASYVRDNLPEKSPGAVYLRLNLMTNKDVFNTIGIEGIVTLVEKRIEQLKACKTLEEARYVSDPVRLFVKREAHKMKKALQKRWRIIWGISLIDQIIDRILYDPVVQAEIQHCSEIPAKPGYSFKYGGTDKLVRNYDNGSTDWQSFDCESFDITAAGWSLEGARELNERLCITPEGPVRSSWVQLSKMREQAVLYGSFVFSNGVVCKKTRPCIQPSGRLTTISTNCKIVVMLRFIYELEHGRIPHGKLLIAMGDDTVQDELKSPQHFVDWCALRGYKFTIESVQGLFPDQNFCSTEFFKHFTGVYVPRPLNWKKNSYELCHPEAKVAKNPARLYDNRASCLQSLCCEYVFTEHFDELHRMLGAYAPEKFRSRKFFESIVAGFESSTREKLNFHVYDSIVDLEASLLSEEESVSDLSCSESA